MRPGLKEQEERYYTPHTVWTTFRLGAQIETTRWESPGEECDRLPNRESSGKIAHTQTCPKERGCMLHACETSNESNKHPTASQKLDHTRTYISGSCSYSFFLAYREALVSIPTGKRSRIYKRQKKITKKKHNLIFAVGAFRSSNFTQLHFLSTLESVLDRCRTFK